MDRERDVANAYGLRQDASAATGQNRSRAFTKAATSFLAAGGHTQLESERFAYNRIAAECFVEAAEFDKAVKAYLLIEDYAQAAQNLCRADSFDDAIKTVKTYESHIAPEVSQSIKDVVALHYMKQQDME